MTVQTAIFKFADVKVTTKTANGNINTYSVPDLPSLQLPVTDVLAAESGVTQTIVARDGTMFELEASIRTLPVLFKALAEMNASQLPLDTDQITFTSALSARAKSNGSASVLDDINVTTGDINVTVIGG